MQETKDGIIRKAICLLKDSPESGYKISKGTGLTEASISNWRRGIKEPSFANANILIKYFDQDKNQDENQEVKDLTDEQIKNLKVILKETYGITPDDEKENLHKDLDNENITYLLPMRSMGGSLCGFAESGTLLQDCEKIISPIKGVDFAISVYGESMSPEYPSGSRVLIKKINPSIFIDWGKTYVLDTPNGVIIKEVHECKDKPGYIKCHSINPDPKFSDFDIPLSEVYGMYRVLMCLSAK